MDCGYTDCQIMPISESVPMIGQCDFMNLGGERIHTEIKKLIQAHAFVTKSGKKMKFLEMTPEIILAEETLEDIKLRCCFVSTLERSEQFRSEIISIDNLVDKPLSEFNFKFAPDCDYSLNDNVVLHVPGNLQNLGIFFDIEPARIFRVYIHHSIRFTEIETNM